MEELDIREILATLKKLESSVQKVETLLTGDLNEDRPGLVERVRKLEDWVKSEKGLVYAIMFVILADFVMRIWGLVRGTQ
jgi:hypothetical protein